MFELFEFLGVNRVSSSWSSVIEVSLVHPRAQGTITVVEQIHDPMNRRVAGADFVAQGANESNRRRLFIGV